MDLGLLNQALNLNDNNHPVFLFGWTVCANLYESNTTLNERNLYLKSFYTKCPDSENIFYNQQGEQYIYPITSSNSKTLALQNVKSVTVIEIYYKTVVNGNPKVGYNDETFVFLVDNSAVDEFRNSGKSFDEFINRKLSEEISYFVPSDNTTYECQAEYRSKVSINTLTRALYKNDVYLLKAIDQFNDTDESSIPNDMKIPDKFQVSMEYSNSESSSSGFFSTKNIVTIVFVVFLIIMIILMAVYLSQSDRKPDKVNRGSLYV